MVKILSSLNLKSFSLCNQLFLNRIQSWFRFKRHKRPFVPYMLNYCRSTPCSFQWFYGEKIFLFQTDVTVTPKNSIPIQLLTFLEYCVYIKLNLQFIAKYHCDTFVILNFCALLDGLSCSCKSQLEKSYVLLKISFEIESERYL